MRCAKPVNCGRLRVRRGRSCYNKKDHLSKAQESLGVAECVSVPDAALHPERWRYLSARKIYLGLRSEVPAPLGYAAAPLHNGRD